MLEKFESFLTSVWDSLIIAARRGALPADKVAELVEQNLEPLVSDLISEKSLARAERLKFIVKYLREKGFPSSVKDRAELSLIPLILNEAHQNDIGWTKRNANLKHLTSFFDADFLIQNQGRSRLAVTDVEFKQYVEDSRSYIEYWRKRNSAAMASSEIKK